jgi:hypothetical protein
MTALAKVLGGVIVALIGGGLGLLLGGLSAVASGFDGNDQVRRQHF